MTCAGSVVGTNLTFRNGISKGHMARGGCVYNEGRFACENCVFKNCSVEGVAGVSRNALRFADVVIIISSASGTPS